ncbi:stAR-related lipid transfer protein 7, mitochondrial-like [Anthonomus grandis grandis]|uniref:stAR-related lipid transfer protein 7, mitochondrial-like n=1 Tax=Anthonomus grandis grandis TaxID=2921223 RepID=UPI002164FD69|nr:stAR-related lipid transfer protein 7, mitochondrial-like [Anthonomus grandis grandis]
MYARRISCGLTPTQHTHNLSRALPEKYSKDIIFSNSVLKRQFFDWGKSADLKLRLERLIDKARACKKILLSKSNPEKALRSWIQQFECVFAQRVRRGQQMICLYSKWWEERALREFLRAWRSNFNRHGRELMVGALGVSVFNWDEERIKDEEFMEHLDDLKYINVLKEETICLSCAKEQRSTKNTRICECGTSGVTNKTYENWVPFIEKDDLVVWRRPHGTEGLFEYKVYGSYHDVTAEDFLNVQVDTNYRKDWDTTAVKLEIGERDTKEDSNSDILYWEMQWPRLFVNRDYVFNRRFKVFRDSQTIVIINKTTEYAKFPKYPDKFRVEEYWSCMVIRPYENMNELGIEFSLTYFDNPGVNIPGSITTWVAKSAMPDYLSKLRSASRNYKQYCLQRGTSKACEIYQQEERERREEEERNKLEYCSNDRFRQAIQEIFEDFQRRTNERFFQKSEITHPGQIIKQLDRRQQSEELVQQTSQKAKQESFWRYFHPLYYFT